MKTKLLCLSLALAIVACAPSPDREAAAPETTADPEEVLWEAATLRFEPLPPPMPEPADEVAMARIELGRKLYTDTRLSKDGNISCDSCHGLRSFGVDNLPKSPGDTGELGGRNSPTVLNAALNISQFWDGRAADVEEQAGMPILNPVEMAIPSEEFLIERLSKVEEYGPLFAAAFPEADEPLTYENLTRAIGAFERTLLTPSRFDDYLTGERDALVGDEKEGLDLFIQIGCTTCHNGVNVGATSFQKFGLTGDYWELTGSAHIDEGRKEVTGAEEDLYVFRVPTLRNVEKTGPYFHDGSVTELDEAVRIMGKLQLARDLTEDEVSRLVAFLESLTGELPETVSLSAGG